MKKYVYFVSFEIKSKKKMKELRKGFCTISINEKINAYNVWEELTGFQKEICKADNIDFDSVYVYILNYQYVGSERVGV